MKRISHKPPVMPAPTTLLFLFIIFISSLRIAALFVSPLELSGDEAQYWAWAKAPALGYFSKPPLIAWVISASTVLFGDAEWAVRLAAPLLHALAAVFLYIIGNAMHAKTHGSHTGVLAALLYILMPGVWFSSGIITTDAVLMPAIAAALMAYFWLLRAPSTRWAVGLGLAIGTGFLAKYAMIYFGLGLVVLILFDRQTRTVLLSRYGLWVIGVAMLLLLPNLWWNAAHQFATLSHTAQNAEWQSLSLSPASVIKFWGGQWGIFGLIALPVLLIAMHWAWRPDAPEHAKRLFVFIALPLLIVSVQALLNRANANWAISAYVPAVLLLALWIKNGQHRTIRNLIVATNFIVGASVSAIALSPALTATLGLQNAFKRVHGWQETARAISALQNNTVGHQKYDALLIDNRLFFYAVKYYGRDMNLPPMFLWPRYATPHSHAELTQPFPNPFEGEVLAISTRRAFVPRMQADFSKFTPLSFTRIGLGGQKKRRFAAFEARGYVPLARTPAYEQQWPILESRW
jgi:4-amino-4-deoxy-L-arabinose transferase-like glycosyltransferase